VILDVSIAVGWLSLSSLPAWERGIVAMAYLQKERAVGGCLACMQCATALSVVDPGLSARLAVGR
jgi:hypothetical protein